jgi:xanthine dehydrogenase/oxidase
MWAKCMESYRFQSKLAARDKFNSENRYKKRGIAIVPSKFGLAFTFTTLNQGAALVHVHLDGSVSISHVRGIGLFVIYFFREE